MLSGSIDTHLDSDSAQDYDMDENSSNLNQQAREGIALAARQALIEGEKPAGKRRNINSRRAPKLQASTLLGPNGFRLLRRLSHNASAPIDLDSSIPNGDTDNCHLEDVDPKASRRMQRQRDLRQFDRIMASYRDWTHKLYPKYKFRDLVIKIERLCRTPTLKVFYFDHF